MAGERTNGAAQAREAARRKEREDFMRTMLAASVECRWSGKSVGGGGGVGEVLEWRERASDGKESKRGRAAALYTREGTLLARPPCGLVSTRILSLARHQEGEAPAEGCSPPKHRHPSPLPQRTRRSTLGRAPLGRVNGFALAKDLQSALDERARRLDWFSCLMC